MIVMVIISIRFVSIIIINSIRVIRIRIIIIIMIIVVIIIVVVIVIVALRMPADACDTDSGSEASRACCPVLSGFRAQQILCEEFTRLARD